MRTIKFRAWNNEHGEMVFSSKDTFYEKREFYPFGFNVGFSHYPEYGWNIMQFTGLLDKNGREIYEGDIVRFDDFYSGDYLERGGVAVVYWDEEHHYVAPWGNEQEMICSTWDLAKNFGGEIIGNIYENPELIGEVKE